jgi:hypothetical protein
MVSRTGMTPALDPAKITNRAAIRILLVEKYIGTRDVEEIKIASPIKRRLCSDLAKLLVHRFVAVNFISGNIARYRPISVPEKPICLKKYPVNGKIIPRVA